MIGGLGLIYTCEKGDYMRIRHDYMMREYGYNKQV